MKNLWDSQTVDHIVGSTSTSPWACTGISIDTRSLEKGDLFIPLKGETGDGHAFLDEAAQKKAAAAFISESSTAPLPFVRVPDTLQALEKLGVAARDRSPALRIAVTGSVGKTSTKEMLKWVFEDQGRTHGNVSSYNNHWGVPLTLARMPQDSEFAVFEVGMSHSGEIRPLSNMIQPHIALITHVVEAHVAFFSSLREIALAKAEIFDGMKKGGFALLNRDNDQFELLSEIAKKKELQVFGFGFHENADFQLLSYEARAEGGSIRAKIGDKTISYDIPAPGTHWAMNSLAVLSAVHLAGADVQKAAHRLASLEIPAGRGRRHKGNFTILDESYNANPTSMRGALEILGKSEGKRKIAVIGDMRELGDLSQKRHEELLEPLLNNHIDLVYCCGPYMTYLFDLLPAHIKGGYAPTSLELIPLVTKDIQAGDVITVKASLGTRVKPIVDALLEIQES